MTEATKAVTTAVTSARWFEIVVQPDVRDELVAALTAADCLVVRDEGGGLRASLPGAPPEEAESSLRFFIRSWRSGIAAEVRPAGS